MPALIVESGKIYQGLNLVGDGTGVGILFPGKIEDAIVRDSTVTNFQDSVAFLGNDNYGNSVERVKSIGHRRHGFLLRPDTAGCCNENYFIANQVSGGVGDCVVLDGADGNFWYGLHCEGNMGRGVVLGPTKRTVCNCFFGIWLEDNEVDVHFGGVFRASSNKFYGGVLQSSLRLSGISWLWWGNRIDVGGGLPEILAIDAWWGIRKLIGMKIPRNA